MQLDLIRSGLAAWSLQLDVQRHAIRQKHKPIWDCTVPWTGEFGAPPPHACALFNKVLFYICFDQFVYLVVVLKWGGTTFFEKSSAL